MTMSFELPTVSIIVSAFNGIKDLPATIDSILRQTYTNFEVLVFNHHYSRIARWYRRSPDSRFKFFFLENQGISQTCNQGIDQARGKYMAFVNAGDLWHRHKLQKQISCLEQNPEVGLVYSWIIPIAQEGRSRGKIIKQHSGRERLQINQQNQALWLSAVVRRRCFDRVGLFDPNLKVIPHWDLCLRLNDRCQFVNLAEPLVYWRNREHLMENWHQIETDLQIVIEKRFTEDTPWQQQLKCCSYANASLYLADIVLRGRNRDSAIANNYCHQALQHYPLIGLSPKFMLLSLAIFTLRCLKSDRYSLLLSSLQTLSSWLRTIASIVDKYAQSSLDWMLQEEDWVILGKNRFRKQSKD